MVGSVVDGRYRVVELIGQGSSGEVYLVEHLQLRGRAAVKVLKPAGVARADVAARFRREARAAHRVAHPNIVRVHDLGQLPDGRLYLAMEYVEGESLDRVVHRVGTLALPRVLAILEQLADALDHAHSRGVIHRDLKPGNLLVVTDRRGHEAVKILDFGLAKVIAPDFADSVDTTRDALLGTPHYMAPERMKGLTADERSDIYAVGCIAFKLLTGQPPFPGAPLEVLKAHVNEPAPRPSDRVGAGAVPPEVDTLVLRCLAKDPGARFQNGAELGDALRCLRSEHVRV